MVIWSLNHNVLSIFFKIKRQRLYKSINLNETNNSIEKVSTVTISKKKQQKKIDRL
jgi:hypothetical protein